MLCSTHIPLFLCNHVLIPIASRQERSDIFHTVSAQLNIYHLFPIVALFESHHTILYIIIAMFYFKNRKGKPILLRKYSFAQKNPSPYKYQIQKPFKSNSKTSFHSGPASQPSPTSFPLLSHLDHHTSRPSRQHPHRALAYDRLVPHPCLGFFFISPVWKSQA
jgi:hypothetical protein